MLFNTSLVLLLVRARLSGMDRTHVEASYDLFATPWRTFRQITFPQLLPAIVAGFLLAFTFSFDDYVITSFVSGPGSSTLPLYVFGQMKRGVTPATNAVAAMMLLLTLAILLDRPAGARRAGNARRRARAASVGGASPAIVAASFDLGWPRGALRSVALSGPAGRRLGRRRSGRGGRGSAPRPSSRPRA